MVGLLAYIRHKSVCNLQAVRDNPPWDDLCNCGLRETWRDAVADPGAGLREALADAALWLEAEADHPRPDARLAMRAQAGILRAALSQGGNVFGTHVIPAAQIISRRTLK